MYFALDISSLVSPIIIGTQLTVPFGLILSFIFLKEKISFKKWFLILFVIYRNYSLLPMIQELEMNG